ncbi:AlpA family transcriptional regulator [Vibrio ponticus]|uniref:AlpA family transcriptional regulator n=1 Tax=Vibrio ponticus TaxID=265668 RepID=A0A3N3DVR6_9VIBR|nr:AlpA family transcriptional regulator [Vibrio ponticus]ROV58573.1 AlpA family transcriptional regulator [Vibrio ponticus]
MVKTKLMRLPQVLSTLGLSRSTLYSQIASGLFPKQINIGPRSVAWLSDEIDAVLTARICGYDDKHVKNLVQGIMSERESKMVDK